MTKLQEIYDGWRNVIFPNKKVEILAKRRAGICVVCPHLNNKINTCKICGCYIPAKVRSETSKCPRKKW